MASGARVSDVPGWTSNAKIAIDQCARCLRDSSVSAMPDVIIGTDFFLAHHLVMMPREHRILFTYNGGPVFQARKPDETAADAPATDSSSH